MSPRRRRRRRWSKTTRRPSLPFDRSPLHSPSLGMAPAERYCERARTGAKHSEAHDGKQVGRRTPRGSRRAGGRETFRGWAAGWSSPSRYAACPVLDARLRRSRPIKLAKSRACFTPTGRSTDDEALGDNQLSCCFGNRRALRVVSTPVPNSSGLASCMTIRTALVVLRNSDCRKQLTILPLATCPATDRSEM